MREKTKKSEDGKVQAVNQEPESKHVNTIKSIPLIPYHSVKQEREIIVKK